MHPPAEWLLRDIVVKRMSCAKIECESTTQVPVATPFPLALSCTGQTSSCAGLSAGAFVTGGGSNAQAVHPADSAVGARRWGVAAGNLGRGAGSGGSWVSGGSRAEGAGDVRPVL